MSIMNIYIPDNTLRAYLSRLPELTSEAYCLALLQAAWTAAPWTYQSLLSLQQPEGLCETRQQCFCNLLELTGMVGLCRATSFVYVYVAWHSTFFYRTDLC